MSIKVPPQDGFIESYLICCMTEGKSPKMIEFYSANLKRFTRFLRDHKMTGLVNEIGTVEDRRQVSKMWRTSVARCAKQKKVVTC